MVAIVVVSRDLFKIVPFIFLGGNKFCAVIF